MRPAAPGSRRLPPRPPRPLGRPPPGCAGPGSDRGRRRAHRRIRAGCSGPRTGTHPPRRRPPDDRESRRVAPAPRPRLPAPARPCGPPAAPAPPRPPAGVRRSARARPRLGAPDESGAARLVADLPAELRELVAEGVGAIEVLGRAGLLALGEELLRFAWRCLLPGEQRVEAEEPQQLVEHAAGPGQLAPVAFVDDLEEDRKRLRGVEVVRERIEECLALL